MKKLILAVSAIFAVGLGSLQAQPVEVDAVLFLSADVSGSISGSEYTLQKTGYVNAFKDAAVANLFDANYKVAVAYGEWDSSFSGVRVGWTILDSAAASSAFGDAMAAVGRGGFGGTNPGLGIALGANYINSGIGQAFTLKNNTRVVIDVSGDGTGSSSSTASARDAALAGAVDAVNGITIGGSTSLFNWYQTYVQGGTDSFTVQANSFADFEVAIKNKLIKEIAPPIIPEPSTIGLLGVFGIVTFLFIRRRMGKKA